MKSTQPYQPLLLRILHGLNGIALIAALATAFWTYDTYDGRWGKIPLPNYRDIEGIHGTFGLFTLLIFPAFLVYSIHRGQRRLIQPDFLQKLQHVGNPIWWYTLNRMMNTITLISLTFALFSGKMMDETWLPKGELNHTWYLMHLLSWIIMVITLALHLLINARVGGAPLLLSMVTQYVREKDSPSYWPQQIKTWVSSLKMGSFDQQLQSLKTPKILLYLEGILLFTVVAAWIIPLLP